MKKTGDMEELKMREEFNVWGTTLTERSQSFISFECVCVNVPFSISSCAIRDSFMSTISAE